jgi:hypothetical protein
MTVINNTKVSTKSVKWEQVYEDEETITIWRYNSNITTSGPVEVEFKYKRGYIPPKPEKKKTLGDLAKEAKLKTVKSRVNKSS